MLLLAALRREHLRPRTNDITIVGKPDLAFRSRKLAVFVDGDFWHGKNWLSRKRKLQRGANGAYWVAKIQANRARDVRVARSLEELGWRVIRVWESDVISNPQAIARTIKLLLRRRGRFTRRAD